MDVHVSALGLKLKGHLTCLPDPFAASETAAQRIGDTARY
jgi:hypothetical protein